MMKAQAELIILFALVIASVAISVFVVQNILLVPEPVNVAQLKAALKSDIERLLGSLSVEVVKQVSEQGGYLEPHNRFVYVDGMNVPYWQVCQNQLIPAIQDIENNIRTGLEKRINSYDFSSLKGKYNKDAKISKIGKIEILTTDKSVFLDFYLPASISH